MTALPDLAFSEAQIDVIIVGAAASLVLADDDEIEEAATALRVMATLGGCDRLIAAIQRLDALVGLDRGSPHAPLLDRLYQDARLPGCDVPDR